MAVSKACRSAAEKDGNADPAVELASALLRVVQLCVDHAGRAPISSRCGLNRFESRCCPAGNYRRYCFPPSSPYRCGRRLVEVAASAAGRWAATWLLPEQEQVVAGTAPLAAFGPPPGSGLAVGEMLLRLGNAALAAYPGDSTLHLVRWNLAVPPELSLA